MNEVCIRNVQSEPPMGIHITYLANIQHLNRARQVACERHVLPLLARHQRAIYAIVVQFLVHLEGQQPQRSAKDARHCVWVVGGRVRLAESLQRAVGLARVSRPTVVNDLPLDQPRGGVPVDSGGEWRAARYGRRLEGEGRG